MLTTLSVLQDGFFASLAAIGFGSINNPPRRLLPYCGAIAAVGHAVRYMLMQGPLSMHIVLAGFAGSLAIGVLSGVVARRKHCPSEIFSFPALLPMIPGMYAYGIVQALINYLKLHAGQADASHYLDQLVYNCSMTMLIILMMVVGVLLPKLIYTNR